MYPFNVFTIELFAGIALILAFAVLNTPLRKVEVKVAEAIRNAIRTIKKRRVRWGNTENRGKRIIRSFILPQRTYLVKKG